MARRFFPLALSALLFALCLCPQAQQLKKAPRIGYLSSIDSTNESARAECIRRALKELGYVEGQNIATENDIPRERPTGLPSSRTSSRA